MEVVKRVACDSMNGELFLQQYQAANGEKKVGRRRGNKLHEVLESNVRVAMSCKR